MTSVDIYETNAGDIYLHADGGSVLYQGGIDSLPSEAQWVAERPDGDDMDWSPELQFPWPGEDDSLPEWTDHLGAWHDGRFEPSDRTPGAAGTDYLATAGVVVEA